MPEFGPIVTSEPLDTAALRESVMASSAGALVEFSGIVRDHDQGRTVHSLDYEGHPSAQTVIERCCAEVAESTGLRVVAAHRIGALKIGDVALYAAAAASHRKEAFDACEELVEKIKLEIPIWKRQHFPDGASEWVGV